MKLMYYTGYVELGTGISIAHEPLKVGKKYLVKEYGTWVERNGNGHSVFESYEHYMEVYDSKSKLLLIKGIWPSAFKATKEKNCKHGESAILDKDKGVRICLGCFKKIKIKTIIEVLK